MMTRPASSCRSLYQLQNVRATGVLLMLLLLVVSVDAAPGAAYKGVGTRGSGVSFHCELFFVGVHPRVKIWVGTYRTEALAALACDVVFFYSNRPPEEFNLEYSEGLIHKNCKPRSAYESLSDWKERKIFIRTEANALINLISSQNQAPGSHLEDVTVPPLVPVRQRSSDVACTIVEHFCNQGEQLREFMAWLMRLSNIATQSTHKEHVQTFMQQQSKERIHQLDIEEAQLVGGEQFLDANRVTVLLDSIEARSGGAQWLIIIAGSLPLLFRIFTINNASDIKDASINAIEASFTEQERCESSSGRVTKRKKANQTLSSMELDPDQEDLFKMWRTLPPFSFPSDPDPYPSKQYSIFDHDSLMWVDISDLGANQASSSMVNDEAGTKVSEASVPLRFHSLNPISFAFRNNRLSTKNLKNQSLDFGQFKF